MNAEDQRDFRSLSLGGWRQFGDLTITFDPRLTVLTGENGSGKSTVLTLLARHFEWSRSFSSSPRRRKRGGKTTWTILSLNRPDENTVGRLEYSDGTTADLQAPVTGEQADAAQYDVTYTNRQPVQGLYLTSHRFVAGNYAPIETIPALFGNSEQIFDQFTNVVRQHWSGQWGGRTPHHILKESLIAAAVFGEDSSSVEGNTEAAEVWIGFQDLLRHVFPSSLGYRRLRIREAQVIVETKGADFILDEVSGGLSALIEIAWQIFLRSRNAHHFTVLIDEPENHLHPSLQREIMPALLRAFPSVQFIVATHSPFVVTAMPESAVYVLDYDEDRKVYARPLDYVNRAASADETLRRVLGLDSTMPAWAEAKFEQLIRPYLQGKISEDQVEELRQTLEDNGLASEFPTALLAATDDVDDPKD